MRNGLGQTILLSLSLACFRYEPAAAQEQQPIVPISNPTWGLDPEGEFVVINYDLEQPPSGDVEVSVVLRRLSKPSEKITPKNLIGHAGDNVEPGKKRKIYWHHRRDKTAGLTGDGWYFEITADWNGDDYTVRTRVGTFSPPSLRIESPKFWGQAGGAVLNAEESGDITFIISNGGRGPARKVKAVLGAGDAEGLEFEPEIAIGDILPGGAVRGRLRVNALPTVPDRVVKFLINAVDSAGYDSTSVLLEVTTKQLMPPRLVVADRVYRAGRHGQRKPLDQDAVLFLGDTAEVFLKIRNAGVGEAESAYVHVALRDEGRGVSVVSPRKSFLVKSFKMDGSSSPRGLLPGESSIIDFSVFADRSYTGEAIVMDLTMTERRPRFGARDSLTLALRVRPLTFEERAELLLRKNAYDSVILLGAREIAAVPDSAQPYYYVALAYEQKKEFRTAGGYYQKAATRGSAIAQQWLKGTRVRDVTRVSYRPISPNPFAEFTGTIGLGILDFAGDANGVLADALYGQMKEAPEITKRFGLYSHDALKKTLKITAVDPSDAPAMKTLSASLAIRFVVTGRRIDDRSFALHVVRTADGATVFDKELRNSETSTALADALLLFQSGKQPFYKTDTVLEERRK